MKKTTLGLKLWARPMIVRVLILYRHLLIRFAIRWALSHTDMYLASKNPQCQSS